MIVDQVVNWLCTQNPNCSDNLNLVSIFLSFVTICITIISYLPPVLKYLKEKKQEKLLNRVRLGVVVLLSVVTIISVSIGILQAVYINVIIILALYIIQYQEKRRLISKASQLTKEIHTWKNLAESNSTNVTRSITNPTNLVKKTGK